MKNINFKNSYYIFVILASVILFGGLWKYYPIYGSYLFQDWTYIYDYRICLNYPDKADDSIKGLCPVILEYNFVYPDIWKKLGEIGNRTLFKYLILIFVIFYLFFCLNILKKYNFFIKFLFILSPVSILLIQRGNNDLIIFFLIFLFYLILNNNKNLLISFIPLNLAIIGKVFPIVLVPIYFVLNKYIKLKLIFYLILLSSLLISIYFTNILSLLGDYNKAGVLLAFNSTTLFKIFNFITEYNLNYNIFSIFILLFLILFSTVFKYELPKFEERQELSFLIGSAIIVGSFFLNEGFVYRLIFLIFNVSYFLSLKDKINKNLYYYFIIILFLSLWIEYFTYFFELILGINFVELKLNPEINLKNALYGFSIIFKNMIYWLLNFNLIFISTKIFLKNLQFKRL